MTLSTASTESCPRGYYLAEIRSIPSLSREEEADLAARVADGDVVARDALIVSGLKVVVCIAKGYHRFGFSLDDLLSEGTLGLIRGVESYDPSIGCRLSRYVGFWIRQAMRQAISRTMFSIRLPARSQILLSRWQKVASQLASSLGRTPTDDEVRIAGEFTPSNLRRVKQIARVRAICQSVSALTSQKILDYIADRSEATPADQYEDAEQRESLVKLLEALPELQRTILQCRFGFDGGEPASLRQVADRVGCSHEAVRYLEQATLLHLRSRLSGSVSVLRDAPHDIRSSSPPHELDRQTSPTFSLPSSCVLQSEPADTVDTACGVHGSFS